MKVSVEDKVFLAWLVHLGGQPEEEKCSACEFGKSKHAPIRGLPWAIEYETHVLTECPSCRTEQTPTQTVMFSCVACSQMLFDCPDTKWLESEDNQESVGDDAK